MTEENIAISNNLIPGVYAAMGYFRETKLDWLDSEKPYKCALSIGWNPVYDNDQKAVEVFIIDDFEGNDFYGEILEIDIMHFIRAEALFPNLDALILAI